jgi:hypothetical protein
MTTSDFYSHVSPGMQQTTAPCFDEMMDENNETSREPGQSLPR